MKVGYGRVSTTDQTLDVQEHRLIEAGCERLFMEKVTGTTAQRPQLRECLRFVREGDTLVVTRLDRLARSLPDLCAIAADLARRGVAFVVLEQSIDTSTSTGELMFHMLGAIAQFETRLRAERQREGITRAKARGVHLGRRAILRPDEVEAMARDRADGVLIKDLQRKYRLSKASVYRLLQDRQERIA